MKKILLILFIFLMPTVVRAASRDNLFMNGVLFDVKGAPINGVLTVTFRIYEEVTGGTPLWEEPLSVEFKDGVYATQLGSIVPFPTDLFNRDELHLAMQVEGDSEMTPRQSFGAVPWAQIAETAVTALSLTDNIVTSASIAPGAITSADLAAGSVGAAELASTGVTAGTYGSSSLIPQITVDADGRINAVTTVAVGTGGGDITSSIFKGSGSTTDAVDLGTGEVAGILSLGKGGTGADLSGTGGKNQFVKQSSVGGGLSVGTIVDADIPDSITVSLANKAGQLNADGSDCSSGFFARGVDVLGNAQGCTAAATGSVTDVGSGTGLTGGPILTSGTLSFDYSATLAADPTLSAGQAIFDSTDKGILFEGTTSDVNEGALQATTLTNDRTWTLPDETGTVCTTGNVCSGYQASSTALTASTSWSGDLTGTGSSPTIGVNKIDGTKIALGSAAQGDIMFYNGADWARLAAGTSGQFLETQGSGSNPAWADVTSAESMPHEILTRRVGYAHPLTTAVSTFSGVGVSTPTTTGTASAQPALANRMYIQYASSASNGGTAGFSGPFTETRPGYRPKYTTVVRTDSVITGRRIHVGLAESSLAAVVTNTTGTTASTIDFVSVAYDTGGTGNTTDWLCCSGDGTNYGCSTTGVAVAASTEYTITLDWTTVGSLVCTVNGTRVTKTTNLSTAAVGLGFYNALTNLTAAARNHQIAKYMLEQN